MKKILALLTIFTLALSCGKEGGNTDEPSGGSGGSGGGGSTKEIESITLPSSTLLISVEMTEGKVLPVTLAPEGCTSDMLTVALSKDGIVSWSAAEGGILFKPLQIGEVEATVKAKAGAAASKKATIRVMSQEDYSSVAISKIEIQSSVALMDGDTDGKVVSVKLTPSEASSDMLKWSGGEEYVTVSAAAGGLKFVPKKRGSTSVKIEARKGSASAVSIAVEVLSPESFSEYVITGITWSPSTIELKDNETVDVTLGLTPSEAGVSDISVSSKNGAIATVAKGSGKVIKISGKSPGETKIVVSGLRDGSKSVEIPVKVYGHVTAVKIDDPDNYDLLKGGSGKNLTVTISKTGELKSQPKVTWRKEPENTDLIELSESGYVRGIKAGGSSVSVKVVASVEDCTSSVSFHVYDYATSVQVDAISGTGDLETGNGVTAYNLKQGQSCNFKWRVLPATAKQEYSEITLKPSNSKVTVSTVKSGSDYKTTVTAADGSATKELHELIIRPVNPKSSTVLADKLFYFNQYLSTDVKPGDYVYYSSSNSSFYWSDGGLRCAVSSNNVRLISKSQQSGLGKFIGKVYSENVPTSDDAYNALNKKGFANKNGAHACVLSAVLAYNPDKPDDPLYWRFTDQNEDIYAQDSWKDRPYKVALQGGMDYSNKLNIRYFNSRSGGTWKIKPGDLVFDFDKETFGTISDYSKLSHTGWMLPMMSTARDHINFYSKCFEEVFSGFSDFKRPNWPTNLGSQPYSEYWTGQQYSKTEAHIWTFMGVSQREKDPGDGNQNTHKPLVRPILWL